MPRSALPGPVLVAALVGSLAVFASPFAGAQEGTPAADCPAASAEDHKAVVTRFLEASHAGDDAAAAELAADGITYHSHRMGEREGDAEGFLRGQRASFPDAEMTVEHLVAEGDTVAAYVSWSGTLAGDTHRVAGQDVPVPVDQRDAEWVGAIFFHMECGQIAEVRPVIDRLGHLMQLGVISEDDLRSADAAATPQP
jgi:predicted ester cyclase